MTTQKLRLAETLELPIEAATQTFALIGHKGSGKTYASGKLVELLLSAGVQVIVLDLVGKWWGLRLAADGRSPGYDIPMFGGLRGDIPLEAGGGTLVADALLESGRSAILDVSQFSKAGRQEFAFRFGERLWQAQKALMNPTPIHIVIEESQLIVPENISGKGDKKGHLTQMYGVFEEIIRLGRNYGIGTTMISQRPQSVAKEVLNMAEPLLVFRLLGHQERMAIRLWMRHQGMDEKLLDTLPTLPQGMCWFWSPEWMQKLEQVKILPKWTFDSTATPKVGAKLPKARPIKPLDLTDLHAKMRETIERAQQDNPKALRQKIVALQQANAELAKKAAQPATPVASPPRIVEKPVVRDSQIHRIERLVAKCVQAAAAHDLRGRAYAELSGKHLAASERLMTEAEALRAAINQPLLQAPVPPKPAAPQPAAAPAAVSSNGHAGGFPAGNGQLVNGQVANGRVDDPVLAAAIQFSKDGLDVGQIGVLTGYKKSTRNAHIKDLVDAGYLRREGSKLFPTPAGIAAMPDYKPLPTGRELLAYWRERLPEGERAVLDVVVNATPHPIERNLLGTMVAHKKSTLNACLKNLRDRGLLKPDKKRIEASDAVFDKPAAF